MKTNKFFKLLPETICLCLLMGGVFSGYSQGYASFFGSESTRYHIFSRLTSKSNTTQLGVGTTYQYELTKSNTAIFHDRVYFKVKGRDFYIREDTIAGQLFRYYEELDKEVLVCDMSLSVGDTFVFPVIRGDFWWEYQYWEEGKGTVVDSVAYIEGKKILYFSLLNDSDSYFYGYNPYRKYPFSLTFTEGIGATYGPLGYIYMLGEPYLGVMLCVEKNDTLAYMTSDTLGCNQDDVSLKETEFSPLRIYPNPATTSLYLDFGDEPYHPPFTIYIIDLLGKVVWQSTITSLDQPIPVRHLPPGMYILQCRSGQKTFRNKFIKR